MVRIQAEQWKGYLGTVASITATHTQVDLHSCLKKILVKKGWVTISGDWYGATDNGDGPNGVFGGSNAAPTLGGDTPMYGGATPMHGGATPMHGGLLRCMIVTGEIYVSHIAITFSFAPPTFRLFVHLAHITPLFPFGKT